MNGTEFDRGDMVRLVAEQSGQDTRTVEQVLDVFFAQLPIIVAQYGRVELNHFGVMTLKHRAARSGTAPNGDVWTRPERQKIVYKPAPAFCRIVSQKTGNVAY